MSNLCVFDVWLTVCFISGQQMESISDSGSVGLSVATTHALFRCSAISRWGDCWLLYCVIIVVLTSRWPRDESRRAGSYAGHQSLLRGLQTLPTPLSLSHLSGSQPPSPSNSGHTFLSTLGFQSVSSIHGWRELHDEDLHNFYSSPNNLGWSNKEEWNG